MIKSIPLTKLVQSPRNVRRHCDPAADSELKASIAAHGLLQNLIVRPAARGKFEVEAGERRRCALLALAEEKVLPKGYEVTCLVLEDDAEIAVETSLAENFHRLAMNPADEAQAFAALIDAGASTEDVARRFGLTVRFVDGRLRLATLANNVCWCIARRGSTGLIQIAGRRYRPLRFRSRRSGSSKAADVVKPQIDLRFNASIFRLAAWKLPVS